MSKISVAFAVNDGYIQHLLIAIYSLLKNNASSEISIYVLQKDFTKVSKDRLSQLEKHFDNVSISLVDMNDRMDLFKDISLVIDYISIETYFRFVLADLFPKQKKILYLDADILVPGNLEKLWKTDISNYYAAGVEDPHIIDEGYKKEIGFSDTDLYVNAGVLLFNLEKMREDNIVKKLFARVAKRPNVRFQDQDIINMTLKGKIKAVDKTNNFMWFYQERNKEEYDNVKVVHYIGANKPWLSYGLDYRPHFFYLYDEYVDSFEREIHGRPDTRSEKYGLFTYETENVGDDVQSIAARQFLPKVDYHIQRDHIDRVNYKDATNVKLIMNGWYMHETDNWPYTNAKVKPLLISMHFAENVYDGKVKRALLSDRSKKFLSTNGPIGSRSESTQKFLSNHGIKAYFSGCLTLTLHKSPEVTKQDFILAVDVPDNVLEVMRSQTKRRIVTVSPEIITANMSPNERLEVAEHFLALIQAAHCVVSTRLHATLPSLALGTPVLFLIKKSHRETDRFNGLLELAHTLSEDEYIEDPMKYAINKPPKNSTRFIELRKKLIEKTRSYTGYINKGGYLSNSLPFSFDNLDFIQNYFDALHGAYKLQKLSDILTSKDIYAETEVEKYALHLKEVEQKYYSTQAENLSIQKVGRLYNKAMRIPRKVKKQIKLLKGDRS